MPGVSVFGEGERVGFDGVRGEECTDLRSSFPVCAVGSPCADDEVGVGCCEQDGVVVAWSDRSWVVVELAWVGGAEGEDVDDLELLVPPLLRVAPAAGDGRVEFGRGCRRGVQHDKAHPGSVTPGS